MIRAITFVAALLMTLSASAQTPEQPKLDTKKVEIALLCGSFEFVMKGMEERGYETLFIGNQGPNLKLGVMVDSINDRFLLIQARQIDEKTYQACVLPGGVGMDVDPATFARILAKYVGKKA